MLVSGVEPGQWSDLGMVSPRYSGDATRAVGGDRPPDGVS